MAFAPSFALGRRTVERDHGLVDTDLVGYVHADDGRGDHLVDILDGVQYALAQVTALVAVAELERFVLARRCAATERLRVRMHPNTVRTSTSMVGLPRESRISLA